jgi:hypothetical protein
VAMDSLKFHPGPPCPTLLHPVNKELFIEKRREKRREKAKRKKWKTKLFSIKRTFNF